MENETLSVRLKGLRKRRGLSLQKVGDLVGVSKNSVYKWESGTRNINGDQLDRLASFLRCTSDQLLGRQPLNALATAPSYDGAEVSGTVAE